MSEQRQKTQLKLAFMMGGRDESPSTIIGGTEAPVVESKAESPAEADKLMEEILDPENLREALKRVKANKGSAGIDRMTVETPSVFVDLDSWIRRRLRCVVWKQWKRGRTRFKELRKRGINEALAAHTAGSPHGPWRLSQSPALCIAFPNAYFDGIGLFRLAVGL